MKIYTKTGDDGTTGLYDGSRVRKDEPVIELNGTIDEAQAVLGLVRAQCTRGEWLEEVLSTCERDLWIVMAEVATPADASRRARSGEVSDEMVRALEATIDRALSEFVPPANFSVPGENPRSAGLDFARTVVRRAERLAIADGRSGNVVVYLNRLSDLCWALARHYEEEHLVTKRSASAAVRRAKKATVTGSKTSPSKEEK